MTGTPASNQVLPRSLAPLPDESISGYLLRLAHRLDLAPTQLAQLTGLAQPPRGARASSMLALPPETTAAFAHATRLTTAEAAALTLANLHTRYPPVDPIRPGRRRARLVHGLFVKETWIFSRFSRYCPPCLAGDGSSIQQAHGGGWNKLWRLPIVFACPTHQRLLEHLCPACGQPALSRGSGSAMVPRGGDSTLHPTACRASVPSGARRDPTRACGQRLDQIPGTTDAQDPEDVAALLVLQNRMLTLLRPEDTTTISVRGPATSGQYVIDLRILSCVISASWPAARDLTANSDQATLIDERVDRIRRQIAEDRHQGRLRRDNALYDTPSSDAATGAALLATAANITTAGDPDAVRDIVAPLLEAEPGSRPWIRQFLPGDGYCSPGLQAALGPEVGALHIIKRTGVPHHATRRRRLPPPQPVSFGVQHIPQRPPQQWIHRHFREFGDLKQRLLEHFLVIRLAHATLGGKVLDAAIRLGIPWRAADNAIRVVNPALAGSSRHTAFDQAVADLAHHLDTATDLVDYGRRRDTLSAWEISPDQWHKLIEGLPEQPVMGRYKPRTHWGDGKRRLASTWAWTQLTHGDHIYAPAVRPDPQARRPGGDDDVHYVHTRWRHLERPQGHGHYEDLRERLDPFVRRLADEIDQQDRPA
jgi:hypothetical protein